MAQSEETRVCPSYEMQDDFSSAWMDTDDVADATCWAGDPDVDEEKVAIAPQSAEKSNEDKFGQKPTSPTNIVKAAFAEPAKDLHEKPDVCEPIMQPTAAAGVSFAAVCGRPPIKEEKEVIEKPPVVRREDKAAIVVEVTDEPDGDEGEEDVDVDGFRIVKRKRTLSQRSQQQNDGVVRKSYEMQDDLSSAWMADDLGTLDTDEEEEEKAAEVSKASFAEVCAKPAAAIPQEVATTEAPRTREKSPVALVVEVVEDSAASMEPPEVDPEGFRVVKRKRTLSQRSQQNYLPLDEEQKAAATLVDEVKVLPKPTTKSESKAYEMQDDFSSAWMGDDFGTIDDDDEEDDAESRKKASKEPLVSNAEKRGSLTEAIKPDLKSYELQDDLSSAWMDAGDMGTFSDSGDEKPISKSEREDNVKGRQSKGIIPHTNANDEGPEKVINPPQIKSYELQDDLSSAWMEAGDMGAFSDSDDEEVTAATSSKLGVKVQGEATSDRDSKVVADNNGSGKHQIPAIDIEGPQGSKTAELKSYDLQDDLSAAWMDADAMGGFSDSEEEASVAKPKEIEEIVHAVKQDVSLLAEPTESQAMVKQPKLKSYDLQDNLSSAWMDADAMGGFSESEEEVTSNKPREVQDTMQAVEKDVSLLAELTESQAMVKQSELKSYDLQDDLSSAWMDADTMGGFSDSEDEVKKPKPKATVATVKQNATLFTEPTESRTIASNNTTVAKPPELKSYDLQDDLSAAWMDADTMGGFSDSEEEEEAPVASRVNKDDTTHSSAEEMSAAPVCHSRNSVPTFAEICAKKVEEISKSVDDPTGGVDVPIVVDRPAMVIEVIDDKDQVEPDDDELDEDGFKLIRKRRQRTLSQRSNLEAEDTSAKIEEGVDAEKISPSATEDASMTSPNLVKKADQEMKSASDNITLAPPSWLRRGNESAASRKSAAATSTRVESSVTDTGDDVDIKDSVFGSSKGRKRFETSAAAAATAISASASSSLDESQGLNTGGEEEKEERVTKRGGKEKAAAKKKRRSLRQQSRQTAGTMESESESESTAEGRPQSWAEVTSKECGAGKNENEESEDLRTSTSQQEVLPMIILAPEEEEKGENEVSEPVVDDEGFQLVTGRRRTASMRKTSPDREENEAETQPGSDCDPQPAEGHENPKEETERSPMKMIDDGETSVSSSSAATASMPDLVPLSPPPPVESTTTAETKAPISATKVEPRLSNEPPTAATATTTTTSEPAGSIPVARTEQPAALTSGRIQQTTTPPRPLILDAGDDADDETDNIRLKAKSSSALFVKSKGRPSSRSAQQQDQMNKRVTTSTRSAEIREGGQIVSNTDAGSLFVPAVDIGGGGGGGEGEERRLQYLRNLGQEGVWTEKAAVSEAERLFFENRAKVADEKVNR